MQHSVKWIAKEHAELSDMRKDVARFNADEFIEFAKNNQQKYGIIVNGDDFLVSTWYSDSLINDFRKMINDRTI